MAISLPLIVYLRSLLCGLLFLFMQHTTSKRTYGHTSKPLQMCKCVCEYNIFRNKTHSTLVFILSKLSVFWACVHIYLPTLIHIYLFAYLLYIWYVCVFYQVMYTFQVAWIKSDSKAILGIHTHMVSLNPRLSVTHNGHNTWKLHISHVQLNDSGSYMCQVNTDPMKSLVSKLT